MRQFFLCAMVSMALIGFTACEPNTPQEPEKQDTIPASFPKKHLIEEFTGQGCGYCPDGMDAVHEFIGNDTNWVLVLHHAGFSDDRFTLKGSKTIVSALKVNGAPSIDINRSSTNYGNGKGIVFHPGYLSNTKKSQFESETYASVRLKNEYNPATRELIVHVNGEIATTEHPQLMLTVLVKESGMIDFQADNYYTFEGWEEFRHTNAVRAFLSGAKGDSVHVTDQRYSDVFSITLKENWVPENCMVVAFLSEAFKPVVQAEQKPVVAGTQGGADIKHGGVKAVEIPDYYPETSATDGPDAYSGNKSEILSTATAYYKKYPTYGFTYWCLQAYDLNTTLTIEGSTCVPFADIYFFTSLDAPTTEVPVGTYEFNTSMQPGTAFAGFRDDEEFEVGGSMFYFVSKAYLSQSQLNPLAQWLIAEGTLTITADEWNVSGKARNGASINISGTGTIQVGGAMNAPKRAPVKIPRVNRNCE